MLKHMNFPLSSYDLDKFRKNGFIDIFQNIMFLKKKLGRKLKNPKIRDSHFVELTILRLYSLLFAIPLINVALRDSQTYADSRQKIE